MSSELAQPLRAGHAPAGRTGALATIGARISAGWAVPLLVACSLALFAINTRYGIGIMPDSTRYMGINDRPYDAPLYAWLVSLVALPPFIGIVEAATIVGVVLTTLNTVLTWQLLILLTRNAAAALVGTALVILAPQYVTLHASAMSEPLFLTFILGTLLAFRAWLIDQRLPWLLATGALVGLCSLVRFTGPPLGAALALTLLLQRGKPLRTKLHEAASFTLVAASIFFVWMIASEMIAGHSTGRPLGFNGNAGPLQWLMAMRSVAAWMLPHNVPRSIRAVVSLAVLGTGFALAVRYAWIDLHERDRGDPAAVSLVAAAIAIFVPLYFAFLVMAIQIEANLVINSRYAFPAYAATVVLFTCVATRWLSETDRTWPLPLILCVAGAVLTTHVVRTGARSFHSFERGIGFAGIDWKRSPTMAIVRGIPTDVPVWSNGPDAISYVLERPAHSIPEKVDPRTEKPDPQNPYDAQLALMESGLREQHGYVVFLDRVDWRPYLGSEQELVTRIGLRRVATTKDGRVYQLPTGQ